MIKASHFICNLRNKLLEPSRISLRYSMESFMIIVDVIAAGLSWLGRQGTKAIAAIVVVGIAFPWLGGHLKPFVTEAIFVLLCTAFMRVNMRAAGACLRRPGLVIGATAWTSLAIPALIGMICLSLGIDTSAPGLFIAIMFQAVASPIMAAPSLAVLMGLDATLVLITLVCGTALVPITAPLFALVFVGPALSIPPLLLAGKLSIILLGAAFVGFGIRRLVGIKAIERQGEKINGFNIIILFIFVAAIMENVGTRVLSDTAMTIAITALSFVIFFAVLFLTTLVFLPAGRERALAIGFTASQRNMGLMLAATGGALPEMTWLYFALAQFPIFLAPWILQPMVNRILKR